MEIDHGTLVWFAKSFGLFYLLGLSLIAVPTSTGRRTRSGSITLRDPSYRMRTGHGDR